MTCIHQILFQIQIKISGPWKKGHCDLYYFWLKVTSHWLIVTKYDIHQLKYYSKYNAKSVDHEKIGHCDLYRFRSKAASHWLIITKYDFNISNSLQDTRQNQWTIKYRSQWPTNILMSNNRLYWHIIPKYDVHPSICLQDIRQNQWTIKYIPKCDVHISNILQDMWQNHWTMNYVTVT